MMSDLLQILKAYEIWIYGILGLVGLWYVRKLILAIIEWRGAIFGMERENAQRRLNESTSVLILLAVVGVGQFLLVSFVSPSLADTRPLATPTLDILATQTATLPVGLPTAVVQVAATVLPGAGGPNNGCVEGQVGFSDPVPATEISGLVELRGTVSVSDFGFYKYEFTQPGLETWSTIAAGNKVIVDDLLGVWDTSTLVPGDYLLRLVVTDHQGGELPPCVIQIRVVAVP